MDGLCTLGRMNRGVEENMEGGKQSGREKMKGVRKRRMK